MSFDEHLIKNLNEKEVIEFLLNWSTLKNRNKKNIMKILNENYDNKLNVKQLRKNIDEICKKLKEEKMDLKLIFNNVSDDLIKFFQSYIITKNEYSSISNVGLTYDRWLKLKTDENYDKIKTFIDSYHISQIKATIIDKALNGDINAAKYYDSNIDIEDNEEFSIVDVMRRLKDGHDK